MKKKYCKKGASKNNKVIAIGSDHAGFRLKEEIKSYLDEANIKYEDIGCFNDKSVDYPDIAFEAACGVSDGRFCCGILCCGTGIGMAMSANKIPGVRAAPCSEPVSARLSRQHNNANVLALGGRIVGPVLAIEIVKTWLDTSFEGGRHLPRLEKISKAENGLSERKKRVCKTS